MGDAAAQAFGPHHGTDVTGLGQDLKACKQGGNFTTGTCKSLPIEQVLQHLPCPPLPLPSLSCTTPPLHPPVCAP